MSRTIEGKVVCLKRLEIDDKQRKEYVDDDTWKRW